MSFISISYSGGWKQGHWNCPKLFVLSGSLLNKGVARLAMNFSGKLRSR